MTDTMRRGPDPQSEAPEAEESQDVESEATAKKQAKMDKDRAARTSGSGIVSHTVDNALAGTALAADEKAARADARNG